MRAASQSRGLAKILVRPAFWCCACNLLATILAAQCQGPTNVPNGTYTSGDHSQVDNNALSAGSFALSGSATATFVAGNCIQLLNGFSAQNGTAATMFHAWVETAPSAVSVSPSNGSGLSQPFTWTVSSPSGYSNLADAYALFNTAVSGANACYIHYNQNSNLLYLADNSGASWLGGLVPGISGTASNSYCSINGSGSSVNGSGTQLALTVSVTFQTSLSGTMNEYLYAQDNAGLTSEWQQMGTWTVPPPPPDFTVTLSANQTSIIAGAAPTYTVSVNPINGFNGVVTFAAAGLPGGSSTTFSPTSVTGSGSTTMTLNTVQGGVTGNYGITVVAASGALNHASAPVSLAVQDFTITLSPANSMLPYNTHLAFAAAATGVNGYTGSVNLTLGQTAGNLRLDITPNSTAVSAGSQLAFDAISYDSTSSHAYTLQLDAYVGAVHHYVYAYLISGTLGDFSLSPPTAQTVPTSGGTATFQIPVTSQNGFSGSVSFTVSGVPSGMTYTTPAPVTSSGLATLTVTAPSGAVPGSYSITVTGTYQGTAPLTHTVTASLVVASGPAFTITTFPSPQIVSPTGTASYTIQTNPSGGFSGNISLTVGTLPPGMTASLSANPIQAGQSSVLTLATNASTPLNTYYLPVYGSSGSLTRVGAAAISIVAASPATMISPGGGSILNGSPLTFTWNSGIGATQYQLSLGSSPGAADYFSTVQGPGASAYCPDGTLRCHSAAAGIPSASQPQTIYATLSSLISGSWQVVQYNYRTGLPALALGGAIALASAPQSQPSNTYSVTNNNQPMIVGGYQQTVTYNGQVYSLDAGYISGCSVSGSDVTVGGISIPSQEWPDDYSTFDLTVTADYAAAPGSRAVMCTVPGLASGGSTASITIYDANPQIDYVYQYPPDYPGGPFYISVYGTNFGPTSGGTLAVCSPTASNCGDGTPDITVSLAAPYAIWTDTQINALLTPAQNAAGDYLVQVASAGESGLGFASAPQGQTKSQSNFGKVTVGSNPVSLTLNRQSLLQVAAEGSPTGGQYSTQVTGLPAAHQLGVGNPVQLDAANTTVGPNSAVIAFKDPANPNSDGTPAQGGTAEVDTIYVAPSGISALKTYSIPAFGMSCYFIALEADYYIGQTCRTITNSNGTSYSGVSQNPQNIQGTFCNSFLYEVRLQGAGVTLNGTKIQYDKTNRVYKVITGAITGSDGSLLAGQTVARDYAIIPKYSNPWVSLDRIGDVQATDTGSLGSQNGLFDRIAGYRLDLYNGAGASVCNGSSNPANGNPILVGACTPALPACPAQIIH
jgi:hypothetical protein